MLTTDTSLTQLCDLFTAHKLSDRLGMKHPPLFVSLLCLSASPPPLMGVLTPCVYTCALSFP
jgi:hypothetical protein